MKKRDNWCCICTREGHKSHACPDGEAMRRSTEQARLLERALRVEAPPVPPEFVQLMEQPCANSSSSPP